MILLQSNYKRPKNMSNLSTIKYEQFHVSCNGEPLTKFTITINNELLYPNLPVTKLEESLKSVDVKVVKAGYYAYNEVMDLTEGEEWNISLTKREQLPYKEKRFFEFPSWKKVVGYSIVYGFLIYFAIFIFGCFQKMPLYYQLLDKLGIEEPTSLETVTNDAIDVLEDNASKVKDAAQSIGAAEEDASQNDSIG